MKMTMKLICQDVYHYTYLNAHLTSFFFFKLSYSQGVSIIVILLVTAAVWRDPQLTVMTSHDGETSSRAGNAWIDMNTSSFSSPPPGSAVEVVPAFQNGQRIRVLRTNPWKDALNHNSLAKMPHKNNVVVHSRVGWVHHQHKLDCVHSLCIAYQFNFPLREWKKE